MINFIDRTVKRKILSTEGLIICLLYFPLIFYTYTLDRGKIMSFLIIM